MGLASWKTALIISEWSRRYFQAFNVSTLTKEDFEEDYSAECFSYCKRSTFLYPKNEFERLNQQAIRTNEFERLNQQAIRTCFTSINLSKLSEIQLCLKPELSHVPTISGGESFSTLSEDDVAQSNVCVGVGMTEKQNESAASVLDDTMLAQSVAAPAPVIFKSEVAESLLSEQEMQDLPTAVLPESPISRTSHQMVPENIRGGASGEAEAVRLISSAGSKVETNEFNSIENDA
jgi:hypothetical protein